MPLYEYECESCGRRFELIQRFSDPPVEVCSSCGGPVHKLLSAPAIQFKGSGWYVTDYAKKGSANGSSKAAASPDSGSSTEKSSPSSDTSKNNSASTPDSSKQS